MTAVLAVLALSAGALSVVTSVRGPHVRGMQGDPAALVTRDGSRLLLELDQPLSEGSLAGVSITPDAPLEATLSGSIIELRFSGLLDYGTEYRVTAPDLEGLYTGRTAALDYRFTTPSPDVYTLVRDTRLDQAGGDRPDSVVRHSLDPGVPDEEVFAAPRIQEYAITSDLVGAIVLDEQDGTTITMADLDGDRTYPLPLPGAGVVRQLRGSGQSDYFGFSFSGESGSETFSNALFLYDTRDLSGVAEPVRGLDDAPLQIIDYRFVPGTTAVVAHAYDETLYLIDASGGTPPRPLGSFSELLAFIPGSTSVAALSPTGITAIDLTAGESSPLEFAPAPPDSGLYPGRQVLLDAEGAYLQLFSTPTSDEPGGPIISTIVRAGTDEPGPVYTPAAEGSRVRDFCVSPNRQYVAVETASVEAAIDDYPAVGGYEGMTTTIVDIDAGEQVASFYGFLPDWCR